MEFGIGRQLNKVKGPLAMQTLHSELFILHAGWRSSFACGMSGMLESDEKCLAGTSKHANEACRASM